MDKLVPPPPNARAAEDTDRKSDETRRSELLERTVHDLKNPLAVVRASLEWLEVELAERDEAIDSVRDEALDAVRDAATATTRLLVIVDDLDTLAHIEGGRSISRDAIDVDAIIGQVTATAGARLARRGMTVTSTAPPANAIMGDSRLIARSLDALIDVCARGAPRGACVEIEVRAASEGADSAAKTIEIEVGLRGTVGNAPATSSLDAVANGGLGIYIALQMAVAHGGSLHIVPTATVPRVFVRLPRV
jgi:K+-sensing histidine kinase KdpD